jgi:hypothetical protein
VPTLAVVEGRDAFDDCRSRLGAVAKSAPRTSSFFKEAQTLSMGAVFQQSARRLMLHVIPCFASRRWQWSLTYCLPRPERAGSRSPRRRRWTAIARATTTSRLSRRSAIDQPTTVALRPQALVLRP